MKIRTMILTGAAGTMLAVSALGALATPGTGSGTCSKPYAPNGAHKVPNPPAGGTDIVNPVDGGHLYVFPAAGTTGTSGGVWLWGPHGYVDVQGAASGEARAEGYSTDQGNLNGKVHSDPADPTNPTVCIGANGTTVHA